MRYTAIYLMPAPEQYESFEDTVSKKPLRPYVVLDSNDKEVTIQPKVPGHHQSDHPLDQHPTVFWNLKNVVSHPDQVIHKPSKNQASQHHIRTGKVRTSIKKGFIDKLNLPGDPKGDVRVITKYDAQDMGGKNYTLTYIITPSESKLP